MSPPLRATKAVEANGNGIAYQDDAQKRCSLQKVQGNRPRRREVRPSTTPIRTPPQFHEDMRYSTSNEQYLRPTRWCTPREPDVVAMANELGAYELLDYEFAEAAYWFVKTKMVAEMLPLDNVSATLKRGTGDVLPRNLRVHRSLQGCQD